MHYPHFGATDDDTGAVDLALPKAEALDIDRLRITDCRDERAELGVDRALDGDRRL